MRTLKDPKTPAPKTLKLLALACGGLALLGQTARPAQAQSGVTRIASAAQPSLALSVSSLAGGAQVSLSAPAPGRTEDWLFEGQSDGSYKIQAYPGTKSGEVLDYSSGVDRNLVTIRPDTGAATQRWLVMSGRIIPLSAPSKTLEVYGGSRVVQGATADVAAYTGGINQLFNVSASGSAPVSSLFQSKKGIAGPYAGPSVTAVKAHAYYTYGDGRPGDVPAGVEWIPQYYSYYPEAGQTVADAQAEANKIKGLQPKPKNVLAFNEPDGTPPGGHFVPVPDALTAYQPLSKIGIPVGSPACVNDLDSWMHDFMASATSMNYRIDYVCVHSYITDPNAFLSYIDAVHRAYNKPIWITEMAPISFSSDPATWPTPDQAMAWMKIVVPALNKLPYVQRYFYIVYNDATDQGNIQYGGGALFEKYQTEYPTLTALGKYYASLP